MTHRWDTHFLNLALANATMSKDPRTRVGAVIVGPDREIRSAGFNGLPRGIADDARLADRSMKLKLTVHAELNAVLNAARVGIPLKGCTLYVASDPAGLGMCSRCAVEIIQAGIVEVVSWTIGGHPLWAEDVEFARGVLGEGGVVVREVGV